MSGETRIQSNAHLSGTAIFVRRPVLAFVLNALIVLTGLAALGGVEVRELPDIDRPVVTITTDFPSAAPETVDREVTAEIEGAAGRISGVRAISSNSRFGRSQVTIEFGGNVNLDVAAADTRDAIARIRNSLPDAVEEPRIVKADANSDAVMRVAVLSPRRTPQELTTLVEELVEDRLLSATGVADLQFYGGRSEVFRIDIDMMQLAGRGLTVADVRSTVRNVALDAPAGAMESTQQSLVVRATAAINSPAEFEALMLGDHVRLGDVARVTLGPAPGQSVMRTNGQPGIGLGIIRQAQSNTLEISASVRAAVDELARILPEDVEIFVTGDDAEFIAGSIDEVMLTLLLAVIIVVGVIYLFLRDARATLIPAISMPVALIGTLAAVYLAGFSVNIMTLLALVLATGLVVDDAIVVLENIVRRRAEGMGARAAAVLGTRQVFFAVVATTTTLAAVFIPLSFLPGQTGGMFREFGFTLAFAVGLSSVVALTLCPVMASRLLRPAPVAVAGAHRMPMERLSERLAEFYAATLRMALAAPLVVVTIAVLFGAAAVVLAGTIRQELTPTEDRANVLISVTAPQGVSLDYTVERMREIEDLVAPLRQTGEVANIFSIAGTGSRTNTGIMNVSLATWGARDRSQQEIVADIDARLLDVIGVRTFVIQPNSLGIRGAGRGLTFAVVGSNYDEIARQADLLAVRMEAVPALGRVSVGYDTSQPQLFIEVDRDRASDLGVDIDGLGEALQSVLDGRSVGTVFIDDRSHDIIMLSTGDPVNDPGDLERVFVRAGGGEMVPMSSFVRLEERAIAPELAREAQMRAVEISAGLTPQLAIGDALALVQGMADEVLTGGSRIVPLSEAATLEETSAGLFLTFGFAILIVFLVLAAQFESFLAAVIVMATVPLGLACAIFALALTGGSLNVYSQIGLVLMVGIMAKNGILIVEFANQLRDEGRSVRDAITDASTIRLRPVMMTMASTVLGGVPLVLSTGAGAEAREALGWIIVGGLGLATVSTLYLTPVAYLLLAGFSQPKAAEEEKLRRELDDAAANGAVGPV